MKILYIALLGILTGISQIFGFHIDNMSDSIREIKVVSKDPGYVGKRTFMYDVLIPSGSSYQTKKDVSGVYLQPDYTLKADEQFSKPMIIHTHIQDDEESQTNG